MTMRQRLLIGLIVTVGMAFLLGLAASRGAFALQWLGSSPDRWRGHLRSRGGGSGAAAATCERAPFASASALIKQPRSAFRLRAVERPAAGLAASAKSSVSASLWLTNTRN